MPASQLDLPPWIPPKPTTATDLEWAPLNTLDLSLIKGDNFDEIPTSLVENVGQSFNRDGFMYAENHGWSHDQVLRQFAIGQAAFNIVSDEDKVKYKADMINKGSFVGFKPAGHWKSGDAAVADRIEQLNFGTQSFSQEARQRLYPQSIQHLIPEIDDFNHFNHDVVLRKVLNVLSLVLKLPVDTLWNLSNDASQGLDLLRYALYHTPEEKDDKALGGVRLQGHTDFNSVSILWSQPITSLEVLMPDNQWRLVKHRDNAIVLNLGDAMQFLSGGFLKPTIHRVVAPPADQAHYERLGVFFFGLFNDNVPLEPLTDSPIVQKALGGKDLWAETRAAGKNIPTAGDWERERVRRYGQGGVKKGKNGEVHKHEEFAGQKIYEYGGPRAGAAPAQAGI
ncbi:Clavaminate synthase-like protein [Ceraceosorus guamensis]|uniref:Clavaminate synthase-like protein n=1 Tax=Ceraceosorus guamensis TaxID=1522189 RepID=A0A316W2R4_9BASI|nr:Clavaminate synthase-like protein [Ceraceosorus guamensis]PWN41945.1 Clavaminate synthase-like protein [Ceraceosorus guamensis]